MIETLKKQWFVVLVALIFICFAIFCVYDTNKGKLSGKTSDGKDVIATLDDYSLTADDLYDKLFQGYNGIDSVYKKFQNLVISKTVKTTDDLKKRADEIEEQLISAAKSQASSANSSGASTGTTTDYTQLLANQLANYGFAEDEMSDYCLLAAKSEKISNDYMDAHLDELFAPIYKEKNSRTVSHILIQVADPDKLTADEQKKLDEVDKALADGTSFADVAKKYSEDTGSKEAGGYLGLMDSDTSFVDSFKKQALSMKKGEVSGWVKESNDNYKGFHKIMINETDKDTLENDKDIRSSIYQAISTANPKLPYTYTWEAAQKLDIKFGSDEMKKQLLDYMGIKE